MNIIQMVHHVPFLNKLSATRCTFKQSSVIDGNMSELFFLITFHFCKKKIKHKNSNMYVHNFYNLSAEKYLEVGWQTKD